ncbi:MAG TPA: SMP-30/gluconolactonase/LRE family protein [Verrucomicrobiae bacterium]|nr:SMP-30/gluconolactonase/LRE family protein [Verrucomicrobiae bacterium]
MTAGKSKLSQVVVHICASLLILLASGQASAADDSQVAARASLERIQSLRKQRPDDGLLVFYEAITRIGLGERDAALTLLRTLKSRKLGLVPVRDAGFETVWGDPGFQKFRKELADDEPRTPDAPVAFRLTDPKLIPEGIAYDAKHDRFFIGSVAQKKIVVTDRKGDARDFSKVEDKLDCVLGVIVDLAREHLYAVSTNGFLDEAKAQRRNAVVRYDLKTGRLADRFDAPEAMQLNDVAIDSNGAIYATDSMSGTLFRKKANEKTLTAFGSKGAVAGANGITFGADGNLYVAISTGIVSIDTSTGAPTRLLQPDTLVTGGCDGLYWYDGGLIGIQNVTNPGRVVRIELANKGARVAGLVVLQSHHHPDFAEPTTGTIAHDALHVVANSYVGHFQPDATIKDEDQLKGTVIVGVPLAQ